MARRKDSERAKRSNKDSQEDVPKKDSQKDVPKKRKNNRLQSQKASTANRLQAQQDLPRMAKSPKKSPKKGSKKDSKKGSKKGSKKSIAKGLRESKDPMIRKAEFERAFRHYLQKHSENPKIRIGKDAMGVMQSSIEGFLHSVVISIGQFSKHCQRKRVMYKDLVVWAKTFAVGGSHPFENTFGDEAVKFDEPITFNNIRRLFNRAGMFNIQGSLMTSMHQLIQDIVSDIAKVIVILMEHSKQVTVKTEDVQEALRTSTYLSTVIIA